jgi:hypothetical protein
MKAIVAAIVLGTSAAAAQSLPGDNCRVTIVRAPDDARAIVEQWVASEPRCNIQLELRIVPTDGGLYLLARDEYGRMRERVVPDAQAAGVLVASWIAADSVGGPSPYEVRQPLPRQVEAEPAAPGLTVPVAERSARAPQRPRWLAFGMMVGGDGTGWRASWDVARARSFAVGLAGSWARGDVWFTSNYSYGTQVYETFDAKLLAYLARSWRSGRLHMYMSLGAGLVYTSAADSEMSASGIYPTAEFVASVGVAMTESWSLDLGPVFSLYQQTYDIAYTDEELRRSELEAKVLIGVRHPL